MSLFTIRNGSNGSCQVWIQMVEGDPTKMGESFIIGSGVTVKEAVEDAMADLDSLREKLQAWDHARPTTR